MLKIKTITTKKGTECPVLAFEKTTSNGTNDIFLTFDVSVMARVSGLSMRQIYTLTDEYYIKT